MKKAFVLAAAVLLFGCDRSPRIDKEDTKDYTTEESIEAGSGTEISPQLEKSDKSGSRMKVEAKVETGSDTSDAE